MVPRIIVETPRRTAPPATKRFVLRRTGGRHCGSEPRAEYEEIATERERNRQEFADRLATGDASERGDTL